MKKTLVSVGIGAGWSTWNTYAKALAEDIKLIAMVEQGDHLGVCTRYEINERLGRRTEEWELKFKPLRASLDFMVRATIVNGGEIPYEGGVENLEVMDASEPYTIRETEAGHEFIVPGIDDWG